MGYLRLTTPAFKHDQPIPLEYTRDAENVSPPLDWALIPAETQQFALIMDDPDAPTDEPFVHWVVYAIPREVRGLPRGLARHPQLNDLGGIAQGVNSFGHIGYDGPAPRQAAACIGIVLNCARWIDRCSSSRGRVTRHCVQAWPARSSIAPR